MAPSQISYSSIPVWARPGAGPAPDEPVPHSDAGSLILVGVGPQAGRELRRWEAACGGVECRSILTATESSAAPALRTALATARVGVRVWLAGPVGACLALRAVALTAGLEDDEIEVRATGRAEIVVACAHCRRRTPAAADVGDLVGCAGCGRELVIYHHVSRRSGSYLGYLADAETWPAADDARAAS